MKKRHFFLPGGVCLVFALSSANLSRAAEAPTKETAIKGSVQKTVTDKGKASKDVGKKFLTDGKAQESIKGIPPAKDESPKAEAPESPVLASHLIPPLAPTFHFVTPFSGLSRGWIEVANISDEWSNVVVKVYDREGILQEGQAIRLPPHGYTYTKDIFGDRDIPAIADPAVVEVQSMQPICVMNCRYTGSGQGWGFDVMPTRMLEDNIDIPIRGWGNAKLEFANPWAEEVYIYMSVLDGEGRWIRDRGVVLPPKGYASTTDERLFGADLYDLGSAPLIVHFQADEPVAVNLARWSGDRGWGTIPYPKCPEATFPFGSPSSGGLWPNGWMEAVFYACCVDVDGTVTVRVTDRAGALEREASTTLPIPPAPASPMVYVRSNEILGDAHIPAIETPSVARLSTANSEADMARLRSPCATRYSDSTGCAFPVLGDNYLRDHAGEIVYEFPVNGFPSASVELTNVGESASRVTLRIYNAEGELQDFWTADLAPNAYLSTEDAAWRRGGTEPAAAIDIYGTAKPCVLSVRSSGKIKIANARWSDWGAWGFSPLPSFYLEEPTLPRLTVGEPVGGGFVELGGEE